MSDSGTRDQKLDWLHRYHAANPRPGAVTDPAFTEGNAFFDPRDIIQVKYEMLRRAHHDGHSVSDSARAFGFSRPSFYQAQSLFLDGGLPALVPRRPGPKRAHKLNEEVVDFLEDAVRDNRAVRPTQLAKLILDQFGLSVHPRSIERALARRLKKGLQAWP